MPRIAAISTKLLAIAGNLPPIPTKFLSVGTHFVPVASTAVAAQLATVLSQLGFVPVEFPAISPKLASLVTAFSVVTPQLPALTSGCFIVARRRCACGGGDEAEDSREANCHCGFDDLHTTLI